jgi:hypothetical protein
MTCKCNHSGLVNSIIVLVVNLPLFEPKEVINGLKVLEPSYTPFHKLFAKGKSLFILFFVKQVIFSRKTST